MKLIDILNEQQQFKEAAKIETVNYNQVMIEGTTQFLKDIQYMGLAPLTESAQVDMMEAAQQRLMATALLLPADKLEEYQRFLTVTLEEGFADAVAKIAGGIDAGKKWAKETATAGIKKAYSKLPDSTQKFLENAGKKVIAWVFARIKDAQKLVETAKEKLGKIFSAVGDKICGKKAVAESEINVYLDGIEFLSEATGEAGAGQTLSMAETALIDELVKNPTNVNAEAPELIAKGIASFKMSGTSVTGSIATIITKYIKQLTNDTSIPDLDTDPNAVMAYFKENKIKKLAKDELSNDGIVIDNIQKLKPASTDGERCMCDGRLTKDLLKFIESNPQIKTVFGKLGMDGDSAYANFMRAFSKSAGGGAMTIFAVLAQVWSTGAAGTAAVGATSVGIGGTLSTGVALMSGPVIAGLAAMYVLPYVIQFIIDYGTDKWEPATIKTWKHIQTIVKTVIGAVNLWNITAVITKMAGGEMKSVGELAQGAFGDAAATATAAEASKAIASLGANGAGGADFLTKSFGMSGETLAQMDPQSQMKLVSLFKGTAEVGGLNAASEVAKLGLSAEAAASFSDHAMKTAMKVAQIDTTTLATMGLPTEILQQMSLANQKIMNGMIKTGASPEQLDTFFAGVNPDIKMDPDTIGGFKQIAKSKLEQVGGTGLVMPKAPGVELTDIKTSDVGGIDDAYINSEIVANDAASKVLTPEQVEQAKIAAEAKAMGIKNLVNDSTAGMTGVENLDVAKAKLNDLLTRGAFSPEKWEALSPDKQKALIELMSDGKVTTAELATINSVIGGGPLPTTTVGGAAQQQTQQVTQDNVAQDNVTPTVKTGAYDKFTSSTNGTALNDKLGDLGVSTSLTDKRELWKLAQEANLQPKELAIALQGIDSDTYDVLQQGGLKEYLQLAKQAQGSGIDVATMGPKLVDLGPDLTTQILGAENAGAVMKLYTSGTLPADSLAAIVAEPGRLKAVNGVLGTLPGIKPENLEKIANLSSAELTQLSTIKDANVLQRTVSGTVDSMTGDALAATIGSQQKIEVNLKSVQTLFSDPAVTDTLIAGGKTPEIVQGALEQFALKYPNAFAGMNHDKVLDAIMGASEGSWGGDNTVEQTFNAVKELVTGADGKILPEFVKAVA